MVALPVLALAVLLAAGLGPAALLGRRFPPAAPVALAAPLAAGAMACASSLVYVGVPARVICVGAIGSLGFCTIAFRQRVPRGLASYATPVAVAVVALGLASIPALNEGDWGVRTFSNVDPYVWVSQAKSLLDGLPGSRSTLHPDAIAYERLNDEHWPTGLPVTLAGLAWLTGSDPVDIYGAFAAVWAALLALAVFFCASGALLWRTELSLAAGLVMGANGYLLFGSFFGWQAQTALTTFGVLSVFCFRCALDTKALPRERWLAGTLAVAGVATYGWTYVTFAGLTVAALAGYLVAHGLSQLRRTVSVAAGFCLSIVLIGALPLVELGRSVVVQTRGRSAEILRTWETYEPALPSAALGFVPRTRALQEGRPDWKLLVVGVAAVVAVVFVAGGLAKLSFLRTRRGASITIVVLLLAELAILRARYTSAMEWALLSLALTTALLGVGLVNTRSFRNPRGDVLVGATAFFLAALFFFWIVDLAPLYSIRLMGYAAPKFILVALSTLVPRSRFSRPGAISRVLLLATGAAFFLVGTVTAAQQGSGALRQTDSLEKIAQATTAVVDPAATIEIDIAEPWDQAWLAYFLRSHDVSLAQPSVYFTGLTEGGMRDFSRRGDVEYRIQSVPGANVTVETRGFFLNRVAQ